MDDLLSSLTIDEKIRLLNGVGSWNTFNCHGKVLSFSMSDGPHGLRRQNGTEKYTDINYSNIATCFPTASALACSWNVDSACKMGLEIAEEAVAENIQIVLGCGLNIKRTPLCGRNFEYFSEDPLLSGKLAAGYVKGMQSQNVGACLKHFALNNQEKNRQRSSSNVDERTLREIYLKGFEIAVKEAHPMSVMTSYNLINGTYASANTHLLRDILRYEWGFDGIVISDWGANMDAAKSLKAGLDLGMPDSKGYFQKQLKTALEAGQITEQDLDTACERLISKALFFDKHKKAPASVDFEEQHKTALKLALDSAVLLKNDGVLPLQTGGRVIAVGSLAKDVRIQGGGSSHISTKKYPHIIQELSDDFDVAFETSYDEKALSLVQQNVRNNPEVPVLFFCGLYESSEGEGFDRTDLSLPAEQISLYKKIRALTKNVVLVNFSGSPVDLSFALQDGQQARAILHMGLSGQSSAKACTLLITGKANPCGKLSQTWPLEDSYIKPCDNFDINYSEGVLVGYRYYETKKLPVLFEFGYGLSYTSFEYSDLRVEKNAEAGNWLFKVSVSIKNTGAVAGAEIVELYVKNPPENTGDEAEKISRPAIELRDFAKVFLKPSQEKNVTLTLTQDAFSVYSDIKSAFCPVGGTYEICAASSVRNIKLSQKVEVKGEPLSQLVSPDNKLQEKVFIKHEQHKKGEFDQSDNLALLATQSRFIRRVLKIIRFILIKTSKSTDDPAVKIMLSAIEENPLESFISTAPQVFNEKVVNFIIKKANAGKKKS